VILIAGLILLVVAVIVGVAGVLANGGGAHASEVTPRYRQRSRRRFFGPQSTPDRVGATTPAER
jgi:hypothetical protein